MHTLNVGQRVSFDSQPDARCQGGESEIGLGHNPRPTNAQPASAGEASAPVFYRMKKAINAATRLITNTGKSHQTGAYLDHGRNR